MKINRTRLELAKARCSMDNRKLAAASGVCYTTITSLNANGYSVRPSTVGKLCKALNCDPLDIIDDKEE